MVGWTTATFLILVKVEKNITPLPVSAVNVTGSSTKKCIPHFVVVQFGQLFKKGNDELNTFNPQQILIKHGAPHAPPPPSKSFPYLKSTNSLPA